MIKDKKILLPVFIITTFSFLYFGFYQKTSKTKFENENIILREDNKLLENQVDELLVGYDRLRNENNILRNHIEDLTEDEHTVDETKPYNQTIHNNDYSKKNIRKIQVSKNSAENNSPILSLKTININARGVRVLNDHNKNINDQPIEELRVCFTLLGTEYVGKGNKKIYIQIINPNDQIISKDKDYILDDNQNKIIYTSKIDAAYNQLDTDICAFVDLQKGKIIKGIYVINLIFDGKKIGSTKYHYN